MGQRSLRSFKTESSTEIEKTSEDDIDKINSLSQKEVNLKRVGVTRFKYLKVIAEALDAVKQAKSFDSQGNVLWVDVPDMDRRQWAAEIAAKLFGDMIERKEIEHDIGDKTLERFKGMTVQQLRDRAREILKSHSMPSQFSQDYQGATDAPIIEPVQDEQF